MSLPHDYLDNNAEADALGPVMGMIGPLSMAESESDANTAPRAEASIKHLHVNRSTLILPDRLIADDSEAMRYLAGHEEISHVLLAGSDSLDLPIGRLREVMELLAAVEHIRMIRLCSRIPALQPERIIGNGELLDLLSAQSNPNRSLHLMMQFHRPEEVNNRAAEAFRALSAAGVGLVGEVPFLPGSDADPDAIVDLLERLTRANVIPYQFVLHQPAEGSGQPRLTLEEAYRLAETVKSRISGPARRARLTMKHSSGYVEILAIENGKAYVKGHLSNRDANGRFMILDCPAEASSFEELKGYEPSERTGKSPSDTTYLKVPYEIPD
ncbi:hypothetical protein COLU111180_03715 [Cohnella lubricantis]|uniref:Radical SAM protein n=1 Tax=Cohnella lubricantis TaxID=2163172 RepID=A0A841TBZ0_9BACL|nr:hypothetical protein [Cohnella lubricantis]MBB6676750.1 hypothetical protein [Cohnella lubricantis]MBP2117796.1 L-lysine 2,3-aminomutase [Cohnella lubricantis]